MLQFYFLSVLSLLLGGMSLLAGSNSESAHLSQRLLGTRTFQYSLGGVAVIVGLLKLFILAPGDQVAVAGDLLPAIAGMAMGLTLVGSAMTVKHAEDTQSQQRIRQLTRVVKVPIGAVGVVSGLAHFFVPWTVIV
jgi:hypothetical protein